MIPRPTSSRRGYTLLETTLSISIVVIILGAIVSVMMLAQRGLASSASQAQTACDSAQAAQMIILDLSLATSITESTATAVTMVVPDRDGGGQPETIRYTWSGVAGAPLTRQYNGGTVAVLVDNVYQFKMTYLSKTIPAQTMLPLPPGPLFAFAPAVQIEGPPPQ